MNREVCQHGAPLSQRCERCGRQGYENMSAAWDDGYAFGKADSSWWSSDQDPATMGLYLVRDSKDNVEVATWLCDWNGKNGEWTRELRDVDRDDIVAWMKIPDFTARQSLKQDDRQCPKCKAWYWQGSTACRCVDPDRVYTIYL